MLEAVHWARSCSAVCAVCATDACASLAPLASGSDAVKHTLTMKETIADNFRTCALGKSAEASACFSRIGAADVQGLGRVEESWDPVVDETGAVCGPASLRFFPSTARFTVSGKGEIDVQVNGACLPFNPPSPVVGTETYTVTGG